MLPGGGVASFVWGNQAVRWEAGLVSLVSCPDNPRVLRGGIGGFFLVCLTDGEVDCIVAVG